MAGWSKEKEKRETIVVQVFKMKIVLEVIFRGKLSGAKTVFFFYPYGFSESMHVIRTQIKLLRFSLPVCAF